MASPASDRDVPNPPREEPEPVEPINHPAPACQEAQKWIEAVTGRSFGDKDFRSGLENGILLCELLSAIKPGLVKKINRLPTPIAGLDNLSVFLRGCEELGLKGSQLFDPGDLQDTSIRANLKDSDCNRKLKNVLNTVFWLGKAASGCASYSGPTLNLKEFEGLLAQMRMECEDRGDSPQKRSVRDSGYDCWDSERSESLSPPQHTRDNSLDSLDSFGSHSQHSPSPDVVNRGNSDGRGSDSEADAPNRKPDVRKDDMLARRTASSESRSCIPFNQFLPNRSNASSYIPTPRRKPRTEECEQRSSPTSEEQEVRSPSPNIILRCENEFLTNQKAAWDSSSDGEGEGELKKVPDVRRDDLASRRAPRGPVASRVHQFVPPPICNSKDRERWEGIRRASQQALQEKEIREEEEDEEEEGQEGKVKAVPNKQKDDLAQRRRAQSRPLPHRDGPMSFVSTSMSQADMQKWEKLRMTEPSEPSPAPVCQACLEKNYGSPFVGTAKVGRGHSKVVTFGGVTEIEQPINTVTSREGEETELLRRLLGKATVAMPTIDLGSQLTEREHSQVDGADLTQTPAPTADRPPCTPEDPPTPAELDARLALYEKRAEEEDEEEEDRIPDLQKDDMMARRTKVFHKQSTAKATYNRFLPLPGSKRCAQEELTTDAMPRNKKEVQADRNKKLNARAGQQQPSVPMETPQLCPDMMVIRSEHDEDDDEDDEYGENGPIPDLEKDDMMARRTGAFQKQHRSRDSGTSGPTPRSPNQEVPPATRTCSVDTERGKQSAEERIEERVEERRGLGGEQPLRRPLWLEDDDLPPMMMSRRVAFMSEDTESVSMSDMLSEEEVGHIPTLSQSRYERMQEQYTNNEDEEDPWQDDLARWKSRRRSASQELIKKEEERKRIEKRMKEEGRDIHKRKSIKTYREIVEEKERRELELREAYRKAETPEEAAMVLQCYALRFTISDATLDSLKLPRSTSKPTTQPTQPTIDSETSDLLPVPLLTAKPYCQPRNTHSGHKPVKMDGLVRVNGEVTEEMSASTLPSSPLRSPEGNKDVSLEQTATSHKTGEQSPPPHTEKVTTSSGSAISSLIGGRNCIITTTIVTELTQTHVEPHPLETPSNGQIETPMLNLAKRVNHWVWDPNEERKRQERWQQEQERLLQEQYQKEQEKLKEEWEKAQREVEEEERRHNEEERLILEETATPLNPSGLSKQQPGQTGTMSPTQHNHQTEANVANVPLEQNGHRISTGNEDQHASKLHFFQDSSNDGGSSTKQELWKTSSLDRNSQLTQSSTVKRSGSHDTVVGTHQSSSSSSSPPQPPSPSRCVSGKRLCSGCSQPLGKGAAMIIDTLGLFFHIQCFKCGVCDGRLGDTSGGTDVRIRNGLLSCPECYIAVEAIPPHYDKL
ncbi:uncharacterized protein ACN63O_010471 [Diretmus argenteus]